MKPPAGIRDQATFAALRASRRRVRSGPITLTFVPGPAGDAARVAYAIGRKVGGAVTRNRLRRRLRAVLADLQPRPGAYLLGAAPEAAHLPFGDLKTLVTTALQALESRS